MEFSPHDFWGPCSLTPEHIARTLASGKNLLRAIDWCERTGRLTAEDAVFHRCNVVAHGEWLRHQLCVNAGRGGRPRLGADEMRLLRLLGALEGFSSEGHLSALGAAQGYLRGGRRAPYKTIGERFGVSESTVSKFARLIGVKRKARTA